MEAITIQITKEQIYQNLLRLLEVLFRLPGANKVQIKQYEISSIEDTDVIRQDVDACYHDILSDIDLTLYTSCQIPLQAEQLGFSKELLLGLLRQEELLKDGTVYPLFRVILKNRMRYDLEVYQPHLEKPEKSEPEDSFWFIAVQALAKLYRRDYLIADHLANLFK